MPTASVASCTVITRSDSRSFLASTTFQSTSGTAFCFTTKYLLFVSMTISWPLVFAQHNTSVFM